MANKTSFRHSAHRITGAITLAFALAACTEGGQDAVSENPYAPGIDTSKSSVNNVEVGHRLIDAGEYDLAIDAYNRAALEEGLTAEVLSGLGSANLGLGQLGQAEKLLRLALEKDNSRPEIWNNLGVVLMEKGKTAEAAQTFRRAYALDDGKSDAIRDNFRLALAKMENSDIKTVENQDYKLVRRGGGDFLIRTTP